jgi:hypothetical protein
MLGNSINKIYLKECDSHPPMSCEPGDWDCDEANELDDMAYLLYIKENNKLSKGEESWVYYTQKGFIGSVGCEKYYEEATNLLRKYKINEIRNR